MMSNVVAPGVRCLHCIDGLILYRGSYLLAHCKTRTQYTSDGTRRDVFALRYYHGPGQVQRLTVAIHKDRVEAKGDFELEPGHLALFRALDLRHPADSAAFILNHLLRGLPLPQVGRRILEVHGTKNEWIAYAHDGRGTPYLIAGTIRRLDECARNSYRMELPGLTYRTYQNALTLRVEIPDDKWDAIVSGDVDVVSEWITSLL